MSTDTWLLTANNEGNDHDLTSVASTDRLSRKSVRYPHTLDGTALRPDEFLRLFEDRLRDTSNSAPALLCGDDLEWSLRGSGAPFPRLGKFGFVATIQTPSEKEPITNWEKIAHARMWIAGNMLPRSTAPRWGRGGSYGLKHRCENHLPGADQYIANGEFILAALLEGFRITRIGAPNCTILGAIRKHARPVEVRLDPCDFLSACARSRAESPQ